MTGVFTVTGLGLSAGAGYAVWCDWRASELPPLAELVELRGTASAPMLRARKVGGPALWFKLEPEVSPYPGAPAQIELRALGGDREAIKDALLANPRGVTVWVHRDQLTDRQRDPAEALQLVGGGTLLLSLDATRQERAALGSDFPLVAGFAGFVVVAVLLGLVVHWRGILRGG